MSTLNDVSAMVLETMRAWYTSPTLAINWEQGPNQRVQGVSGANSVTGFTNPFSGLTHVLKLLQPTSGAAATFTLVGIGHGGADVVLTVSSTSSKHNLVTLNYDASPPNGQSAWSIAVGPEQG